VSFENVKAHGVGGGVVQDESEKIKLQNVVEALGEFVEKAVEVALLRDGFADLEKRFELPAGALQSGGGRGAGGNFLRVVHENENNIRFGEVTTGVKGGTRRRRRRDGRVGRKRSAAPRHDILVGLQARSSVG